MLPGIRPTALVDLVEFGRAGLRFGLAAAPEVLDGLLAKGFKFVTVSQLIAMDRPRTGKPKTPPVSPKPSATPSLPPAKASSTETPAAMVARTINRTA